MGLLKYVMRSRQSALGWAARAKARVAKARMGGGKAGGVVVEVDNEAELKALSYFQQGDASMSTADMFAKRRRIRQHPSLQWPPSLRPHKTTISRSSSSEVLWPLHASVRSTAPRAHETVEHDLNDALTASLHDPLERSALSGIMESGDYATMLESRSYRDMSWASAAAAGDAARRRQYHLPSPHDSAGGVTGEMMRGERVRILELLDASGDAIPCRERFASAEIRRLQRFDRAMFA